MKKFFRYCFLFVIPFTALLMLTDVVSSCIVENGAYVEQDQDKSLWILGHSHPQCAFNDSLIPSLANYASSGESYFYTYSKTCLLLQTLPAPRVAFIEFANNQITPRMNEWTWSDKYLSEKYSELQPFIPYGNQALLLSRNPKGFLNAYALANRRKWERTGRSFFDFSNQVGGYLALRKTNIDSLIQSGADTVQWKLRPRSNDASPISEYNVAYLHLLIDLLRSKNCEVYLVRSPLHRWYSGYENESAFQSIRKDQFSDVEFLDFSDAPLENDEFSDFEHANAKGALRFSGWFQTMIEAGLLERPDKQMFIDRFLNQIPS